jgi:hypothetical protein
MKTFAFVAAALLFSAPAFARNTVVKDASGAWSCQNEAGEVISYYQPFGRVPTSDEQLQCQQSGGKVVKPAGPTKAPMRKDEATR